MKKYKVRRVPRDKNAVEIYPPEGMPAYIPDCGPYAFRMLQRMAASSIRVYDESEVEEVAVGEYRVKKNKKKV